MKVDVISEQDCDITNFGMRTSMEASNYKFKKIIFENWSQYLVLIVYNNGKSNETSNTQITNYTNLKDFNFEYLYNGCSKSIFSEKTIEATILVRRMLVPKSVPKSSKKKEHACLWYLVSKASFPIGSKHLLDDQDIEAAVNGGVSKLSWTDFIVNGSVSLADLKTLKEKKIDSKNDLIELNGGKRVNEVYGERQNEFQNECQNECQNPSQNSGQNSDRNSGQNSGQNPGQNSDQNSGQNTGQTNGRTMTYHSSNDRDYDNYIEKDSEYNMKLSNSNLNTIPEATFTEKYNNNDHF